MSSTQEPAVIADCTIGPFFGRMRPGEERTSPLLLLVHGRKGNAQVMWPFASTFRRDATVIAIQAPEIDGDGYSWWNITLDDWRAAALRSASAIVPAVTDFLDSKDLDPEFAVAYGFSQGAGVLSVVAQHSPEFFSGIALLAGFVVELSDGTQAGGRALPRIFMAHGTEDQTVSVLKARAGAERLRQLGFTVDYFEDPIGHKVGSSGMRGLRAWSAEISSRRAGLSR